MFSRYIAVGLLAGLVSFAANAQQTIEDLVSQASAEWMFGKWEATSDGGDTVALSIQWDLEKKIVVLHVKASDMESKGYTFLDPSSREPMYVSFDNRGNVGKGKWAMESDELVLHIDNRSPDRGPSKAAFVFAGSSSKGLQVRMHTVSSSGDLETPARFELNFKKK